MTLHSLTLASTRVEAARSLSGLAADHLCGRTHGHSFLLTVVADLPAGWAPFAGDEMAELKRRLEHAVRPLHYSLLNDHLAQPTDENIAQWVKAQLDVPNIVRVAVQSTANQGVDVLADGQMQLWRRFRLNAAHSLPHVPLGHKCGRMHGHSFEVIVAAMAPLPGAAAGLAYDRLNDLWAPFHFELNYQCLNDIDGLSNPTSEVLSAWLWQRMKVQLPQLSAVTVYETASCGAHFDGVNHCIWKEFTLDSAVQMQHAPADSPLRRTHGHTYTLRLYMSGPLDPLFGWTVDFGDVKDLVNPAYSALDHHPVYERSDLADCDTASLSAWIYQQARTALPQLSRVDLYQSEGSGAMTAAQHSGAALPI